MLLEVTVGNNTFMFGKSKKETKLFQWAIVDSPVSLFHDKVSEDGLRRKRVLIPEYVDWTHMLTRALSYDFKQKNKCYEDVTVSDKFQRFSQFYQWIHEEQQNPDWRHCQLDKDLLSPKDAKIYSPETCVYITPKTNSFILSKDVNDIQFKSDSKGLFKVEMSNPFTLEKVFVGKFDNIEEAKFAWKAQKYSFACILAEIEKDPRASEALIKRFK